jgi:hypothetical protein
MPGITLCQAIILRLHFVIFLGVVYIFKAFGLFIKDHRVITVKEYTIYEELLKICMEY